MQRTAVFVDPHVRNVEGSYLAENGLSGSRGEDAAEDGGDESAGAGGGPGLALHFSEQNFSGTGPELPRNSMPHLLHAHFGFARFCSGQINAPLEYRT